MLSLFFAKAVLASSLQLYSDQVYFDVFIKPSIPVASYYDPSAYPPIYPALSPDSQK